MSGKWKSIIALPAALGHKDHPVLSVRNDRFAAGISAPPVPGFGRLLRLSSATLQTTSIARPGNPAAAPLHRTFPIVIGETKGLF